MNTKRLVALSILFLLAGIIAACNAPPAPQAPAQSQQGQTKPAATEKKSDTAAAPASKVPKGQIVIGENNFFTDFNPLTLSDVKGLYLFVNEPLFIWDRDDSSKFLPRLAESWEVSKDNLTYTFHLRKNVKFTDGQPFTAADVKFTFDTAMKPETGYPGKAQLSNIAKVETPDDNTVVITVKAPSAVFLGSLADFGIVPKHVLEGQDLKTTTFKTFPIGTGPFIIKEHDAEILTFEYNPNYWGDPPGVAKIILRTAKDAAARSAMLRSGEIDITRYEPDTQNDLIGKGFHVDKVPSQGWSDIEINFKNPLFTDKRVRQAMLQAIDREGVLNAIYQGNQTVASGPLTPKEWSFEGDVTKYSYDINKATQLMTAAGWAKNKNGIWEKDGKTFSFSLMALGQNPQIFQTNVVLQEQWNKFGFDVKVDSTPEWPVWWDRYTKGDFDSGVMSWAYGADPDGLSTKFETGGGSNGSAYSNPALDKLLKQGRETLDQSARKQIYSQVQKIVTDDLPSLWLGWGSGGIIMKDKVVARYDPMKGHFGSAYWWQIKE